MPKYSQRDIERLVGGLPSPEFRARLKADLERRSTMTTVAAPVSISPAAAPVLRVRNAAAAIDFYVRAFGAHEQMRFEAGGTIPHAELVIGDALIVIAEEAPDFGFPGPETLGGPPVGIRLDVDDLDAAIQRAVDPGARLPTPASHPFYGD